MPLLNVKQVRFDIQIYDDFGSYAKKDLTTWKPTLPPGWYYLGPAANNDDPRGCQGVIVQPAGQARVLAPITHWEQVWNDSGSGNQTNFSLWRGLPAEADRIDFVVLGGFLVRSHDPPTIADTEGMMAVHKDVLIEVNHGREIWNDRGSSAKMGGAVWEISAEGRLQAIDTGAFVPVQGYKNPPRNTYALDRNRIQGTA